MKNPKLKHTQTSFEQAQGAVLSGPFGRAGYGLFPRRPSRRRSQRSAGIVDDPVLWVSGGWLLLLFLLGGGSRGDIQSLMILRPLSVLVLAYAVAGLNREAISAHRFAIALAGAWMGLHLLQLVPLPPQIWQALPGRETIVEIDRTAGLGDIWRPLTMVPHGTRNAAWALLAPLAVLLLGIRLDRRGREALLSLVLGLGLLSAVIAGLQLVADPLSAIYFYRVTNHGMAVGLFANRNHHAIFLALLPPMLLVWAALRGGWLQDRMRWAGAAGGILLVIPLILVTGSRAGLTIALLGLLATPAILFVPGTAIARRRWLRMAALSALVVGGLVVLTIFLGRGLALDRLLDSDGSDLRFRVFGTLRAMVALYLPWGSGFGSFTEVYQLHEPSALLGPAYLNHAHNDWLELALTGGWPAIVLAAVGTVGFLVRLACLARPVEADRSEILLGRLGLLILLLLGLASLGDYPLRTPALAALAVLAALWASPMRPPRAPKKP